jgi:hypothetical protein
LFSFLFFSFLLFSFLFFITCIYIFLLGGGQIWWVEWVGMGLHVKYHPKLSMPIFFCGDDVGGGGNVFFLTSEKFILSYILSILINLYRNQKRF